MAAVGLVLLAFRGASPNQPNPVFTEFHIRLEPHAAPKQANLYNFDANDSVTKHFACYCVSC